MRQLRLGNLVIDRDRYCAFVGTQATRLSSKELGLLWPMARHAEKVLTREQLWRAGWGKAVNGPTRTLDTQIARRRRKIHGNGPWMNQSVPRRRYVRTRTPTACATKPSSTRASSH